MRKKKYCVVCGKGFIGKSNQRHCEKCRAKTRVKDWLKKKETKISGYVFEDDDYLK